MGKTLLSVAIAAILSIPAFAQDIIILKNGTSVDAKVIEIDDKGKVKVSHKEFTEKPEGFDESKERSTRPEHLHRPDKSFKGPKKFKK